MPFQHPHTSDNRLQPYAMLIHTPQFDLHLWMGLLNVFHEARAVLAYMLLAVPYLRMSMTRTGDLEGESKILEVIPPGAPRGSFALSAHSSKGRLLGQSTIRHQEGLAQAIAVTDSFGRWREAVERLCSVSADRRVPVAHPGCSGAPVFSLQFGQ